MCSAPYGCAVEISIAAANELGSWIGAFARSAAKRVKRYYDSQSCPEHCAHGVRSPKGGRTVQVAVSCLHHPAHWNRTVPEEAAERVENCNGAGRRDSEQRSLIEQAAQRCRAIKITITALDQPCDWVSAIVRKATKRVERC